ncbi:MAG: peptidogalycan biosysnthesis protein, partial [Nodosilinea sp.]
MGYPATPSLTATWLRSIEEVPETVWDELAQPLATPFLEWSWLHNMERSHSVEADAGWLPCHLALWQGQTLVGAAPMYLKGHSRGEFVFDHQWADLAERLGVDYYPKLLGMSPFTPTEGYRFLIAPEADEALITRTMVEVIDDFCDRNNISGCHFLYADPQWRITMMQLGFSEWLHHSYVWQNQSFSGFDDYLGVFNANQRRNIKRERKSMATAGLRIETVTGDAISAPLCDQMYDFYADTCDKFGWWGSKYLTREFFQLLYHDYCH